MICVILIWPPNAIFSAISRGKNMKMRSYKKCRDIYNAKYYSKGGGNGQLRKKVKKREKKKVLVAVRPEDLLLKDLNCYTDKSGNL